MSVFSTPFEEAMFNSLGSNPLFGNAKKPDASGPVANPNARNSNQAADKKVEEQANALARVNEIRNLWSSSTESQQKALLQQQRQWEESPSHSGEGPLGKYGASFDFTDKAPKQVGGIGAGRGGGGFAGFAVPDLLDPIAARSLEDRFYGKGETLSVDERMMLLKHQNKNREIETAKMKEYSDLLSRKNQPGVWSPHLAGGTAPAA
jgi:hypothetical protein